MYTYLWWSWTRARSWLICTDKHIVTQFPEHKFRIMNFQQRALKVPLTLWKASVHQASLPRTRLWCNIMKIFVFMLYVKRNTTHDAWFVSLRWYVLNLHLNIENLPLLPMKSNIIGWRLTSYFCLFSFSLRSNFSASSPISHCHSSLAFSLERSRESLQWVWCRIIWLQHLKQCLKRNEAVHSSESRTSVYPH